MKIAILSFFSGHHKRGVERWVCEFASRLSKKHEIVVYQNGFSSQKYKYKIISAGLAYNPLKKEFIFPLQKKAFLDYRGRKVGIFTLKILPLLWSEGFDIIIPTDGGWEPALIRILTWVARSKMIIVGHAGIGWDDLNNLWCFPDFFIGLSNYAKSWSKKVNPFIKTEYISDAVDTISFKPKGKRIDIKLKKPIVLCVGALSSEKRIGLTIKAVAKLGNVSLLVAGRGPLEDRLKKLGKKLLKNKFKLKSYNFNQMPEIYRSADVFTLASTSEHSFEMVLIEAMACNLAVVANKDPIRREIVKEAGILVNPENINDYSSAIKKALNIKWGSKPRKQAEKFSWDKVIRKYEKLFEGFVN